MKINPNDVNRLLNSKDDESPDSMFDHDELIGGKKAIKTIEGLQKKRDLQTHFGGIKDPKRTLKR